MASTAVCRPVSETAPALNNNCPSRLVT
ncbi:MAG: hypothetical protein IAF58_05105 [Leptolyngbya sp.]|nr:hypothetical protein [Candidatus Melainabacteria bacterium]